MIKVVVYDENQEDISYYSVKLKAQIIDLGSGRIDDHGFIISENGAMLSPIIKGLGPVSDKGYFEVEIKGLKTSTLYYYKAYVSVAGTTQYFGNQLSFTTSNPEVPEVSDAVAIKILDGAVKVSASVISDGGVMIAERGLCWGTNKAPEIGNCLDTTLISGGAGKFTGIAGGINPGTTYYVRAFARNSVGITYSDYSTPFSIDYLNSVADADSNFYNTVRIGEREWMRENLKTTKYNDGTPIPLLEESGAWSSSTDPAYCWYFNNSELVNTRTGALYNYSCLLTNKLCPTGWRVAYSFDLSDLVLAIGGTELGAIKLKDAGTKYWPAPNNATNSSGFTAIPAGYRNATGAFLESGLGTNIWINTGTPGEYANTIYISQGDRVYTNGGIPPRSGASVRCVRDEK